jgi:hypothetical protein
MISELGILENLLALFTNLATFSCVNKTEINIFTMQHYYLLLEVDISFLPSFFFEQKVEMFLGRKTHKLPLDKEEEEDETIFPSSSKCYQNCKLLVIQVISRRRRRLINCMFIFV